VNYNKQKICVKGFFRAALIKRPKKWIESGSWDWDRVTMRVRRC